MSQTESPAEAIVDLVPAKAKRKPRKPTTARNADGFDEFSALSNEPVVPDVPDVPDVADVPDVPDVTVPKARRRLRSKANTESVSDLTPASEPEQTLISHWYRPRPRPRPRHRHRLARQHQNLPVYRLTLQKRRQ